MRRSTAWLPIAAAARVVSHCTTPDLLETPPLSLQTPTLPTVANGMHVSKIDTMSFLGRGAHWPAFLGDPRLLFVRVYFCILLFTDK